MEYLPSYKNNLYLAHHGIKGQKWGVRRYQNPDGSLTPAGKAKRANSLANKSLFFDMDDDHTRHVINAGRIATAATIGTVGGLAASGMLSSKGSEYYDSSSGLLRSRKTHNAAVDCLAVNMGRVYTGWPGWGNNCGLCSAAYDMRRRGYNVHAGQSFTGIPVSKYNSWYPGCRYESINQQYPKSVFDILNPVRRVKDVSGFLSQATTQMEAHGPGARGVMLVQWATGGGHAIAWENNSNGKAVLCEAQLGIRYRNPVAKALMFSNLNPYDHSSSIVRLDNVEPNISAMKRDKAIVNNPSLHKPTSSLKHANASVNSLEEAIDILAKYYPTMHPTNLLQRFDHYYIIELAPKDYDAQTDGPLIDSLYYVDINNGNCSAWLPMMHKDYLPENVIMLKRTDGDIIEHDGVLMHHGIKGMKWGVRRFEDASGHLTPAGKRRYGVQDARKYYKINRLQRYQEKTNNPKLKNILSGEIRRTQTRSDRKHSDLNQKDINIGREIVAKHRLKWASVNTAAKTALTAAGAAYLYSNPKTRALAPVALAGGAALTYGSAKKIPYYFMENRRYKQVNPKGGTQRGLTKRQRQFRKVGKAAVGAALAGATGYALIKSGAVQQVANRYRNANGSGPSIATQAVMDANKQASKAKKTADRRERFKTAVSQKVRSTASAGTRKAVGALKSKIVPTIDEDDPSTWVNAVRSTGGLLNNIRTNGVKRTAVNMATETAMDGGKYVVDRVGSKVHNVRSRIKNRRKKNS